MGNEIKNPYKPEGILVRDFRKSKGWTAEQLAEKLEVSLVTLSKIENGHRPVSGVNLKKLASLGMNIEDFTKFAKYDEEKELSFSFRLNEVENRLIKMEDTIKQLLQILKEKG